MSQTETLKPKAPKSQRKDGFWWYGGLLAVLAMFMLVTMFWPKFFYPLDPTPPVGSEYCNSADHFCASFPVQPMVTPAGTSDPADGIYANTQYTADLGLTSDGRVCTKVDTAGCTWIAEDTVRVFTVFESDELTSLNKDCFGVQKYQSVSLKAVPGTPVLQTSCSVQRANGVTNRKVLVLRAGDRAYELAATSVDQPLTAQATAFIESFQLK